MRSDMHKLIVERPRRNQGPNKKTRLRLSAAALHSALTTPEDFDGGPNHAPSSRWAKWLNENLAPLKRYLHKQVGRPWRKVEGEIRAGLDPRSAVGLHVLQHVGDFIDIHTRMRNGQVESIRGYPRPVRGLYVHPKTGLIRLAAPQQHREPAKAPPELDFVFSSETLEFHRLDGIWYRIEYRLNDPDSLMQRADGTWVLASQHRGYKRRSEIRRERCDAETVENLKGGFGYLRKTAE